MRRLRTASARHLAAVVAVVACLALTVGIAQAALVGSGALPQPKALAAAILDAIKAPEPEGVTARIEFTNDLLPSGVLPRGTASPLISGADGRLWMQKSGDFRLELQSDAGDAQIVAVGDTLTVYDASSETLYRLTLPEQPKPDPRKAEKLTLAKVQKALDRLARSWSVPGAQPASAAGRPAYSVKVSPKDEGGLLAAAELAWDAVRGAPLRAAVYARGTSDPVLELQATDVSYDAVPDSAVRVAPPAGAEVVDLTARSDPRSPAKRKAAREPAAITSVAGVQRRLGFDLAAPATVAGLPRKALRLVTFDGEYGALAIYGEGLGAIAVLQRQAQEAAPHDKRHEGPDRLRLPEIDVDGAAGSKLATALGTVVTFERAGVAYVVAGSVPPAIAVNAARGLR